MQKWSPEPLAAGRSSLGAYQPLHPATAVAALDAAFRPETGFAEPKGLLQHLSRDERARIVDLLELDLRREHDERARREAEAQAAADASRQAEDAAALARWQAEFAEGVRREIKDKLDDLVRHAADLAVAMATKVVRREVAVDPEVLVRALETVLYKAEAGATLSVTVHPDDARWLAAASELRERLRVGEIKEDRRLARGGCLVKADDLEWDATVERQLAVLGEAAADALAIPADQAPQPEAVDV
ncbi:MAG TPA: FliH/SctL family protein [Candidatus Krumholzibacteria bacterium]|nr:FliH/SctL family protein [Candidatus Krumholzibacteria bacterium]HPD71628.1 FliH/SctL family protein [Candidatus Krumholzibacteria bacterium]HRY41439.1 FliH/SctL family protein [Candidatus Krumholzibacteria bacterium]